MYFQLLAVSYGLHFKQNMLKQHMENCYVSYFKVILFFKEFKSDKILEEGEKRNLGR